MPQSAKCRPEKALAAEWARIADLTERWMSLAGTSVIRPRAEPDGSFILSRPPRAPWTIDNGPTPSRAVLVGQDKREHYLQDLLRGAQMTANLEKRRELAERAHQGERRPTHQYRLADLEPGCCRSVDNGKNGEWLYCGRPIEQGSSYCPMHRRLYYRGGKI